jgi:hypothetical protein
MYIAYRCESSLINSVFFGNLFDVPQPAIEKGDTHAEGTISVEDARLNNNGDLSEAEDDMTKLSKTLAQASIVQEVFDIDASTANLNLFADLLHIAVRFSPWTQPANYEISLEEAAILLPLADMYDCPAIFNILQERVAFLAITNPWEVLVLACDQNDVTMGQTAIFYLSDQLIHEGAGVGYSMTLWENISKLSSAWQLEFLRLYMTSTRRINSGSLVVGHFDGSFSVWAKHLNPEKYERHDGGGRRNKV